MLTNRSAVAARVVLLRHTFKMYVVLGKLVGQLCIVPSKFLVSCVLIRCTPPHNSLYPAHVAGDTNSSIAQTGPLSWHHSVR